MGDETWNTMNLDLNLGPVVHPSLENDEGSESINLEDWLEAPVREAVGLRTRARQRWRSVWRPVPIPMVSRSFALELIGGSGSETGEGSVAAVQRETEREGGRPAAEVTKACNNNNGNNGHVEDGAGAGDKEDAEKNNADEGSFFDCNICLDLAADPVVTCCGHLFCWPCLYRWLHIHSDAKECPICKGEVTIKSVTPIYGRGNTMREADEDSSLKIPHRPQAKRIESWRQTIERNAFTIPMEEMIRRLGSRFDLTRDLVQTHPLLPENPRQLPERGSHTLLNRILTSRGLRREQAATDVPNSLHAALGDSTQSTSTNSEQRETQRLSSLLARTSHRAATLSTLTSALSSAERLVESYFRSQPIERDREQLPAAAAVDDRDSVSSIAAIIQSESQTIDTAVEIDSTVALSTSSSRRRSESSRASDVDSGDSRAPRRRRLH